MLRKKRIQNKIAASRFSLPVTATLAALVWVAVGLMTDNIWVEFAITIVSTLLMVELNNKNALMRTYSRMVSCSFLALITVTSLPYPSLTGNLSTLCLIAFYLILWTSYQDHHAAGRTYYAFIFLGLASTIFVQALYYLPILWFVMMVFTNSFSIRTFMASILGVITPYWFTVGYYAYTDNLQGFISHLGNLATFQVPFDFSQVTNHQIINFSFIIILGIIGTIHFLRTSYADKIRTRMIYESLILMNAVSIIFLLLQPQHDYEIGGILIVNTSPLIAHYITFTKGKLANLSFIVMLLFAIIILLYNLLIPSITIL